MWVQYEKSISAWLHSIRTERIQEPEHPPFLTINHPPTLKASTRVTTKSRSSKTFKQFYSLPLDRLNNIFMWHTGLVHCNKLKPVLARLTQQNPVPCVSNSYKLKYAPYDYYTHYNFI